MNAVEVARSYIGTPYRHQGRKQGVGVDCLGLLILVARAVGWVPPEYNVTGYRRMPDGYKLIDHLRRELVEIPYEEMSPGDFLCVRFDKHPHHVGVIGDYHLGGLSLIHANSVTGRVEESRLVFNSGMQFVAAFRKGVA